MTGNKPRVPPKKPKHGSPVLTIRVTPELREELERFAAERGLSMGQLLKGSALFAQLVAQDPHGVLDALVRDPLGNRTDLVLREVEGLAAGDAQRVLLPGLLGDQVADDAGGSAPRG